jgi:probable rRNA maturation factor
MIFLENTTNFPLEIAPIEAIAQGQTSRDIELILVDDHAICELNRKHREVDHSTDVLSFPLVGEQDHIPLGTVVISIDHARDKAADLGHTIEDEIALLFLHGLLHLLGYDHETDHGQMRQKEHELIHQFALPKSLITRTETP